MARFLPTEIWSFWASGFPVEAARFRIEIGEIEAPSNSKPE